MPYPRAVKKPKLLKADLTQELLDELLAAPEVAVDCEMMGLNPHRDRLCLVQVADEAGNCGIIQVDEKAGAPLLARLFTNPSVIKIFHYARMDCVYLRIRLGIETQNIFCTKVASRMARTYTDRHGLKELVREFTGETMDKTNQSSDWGKDKLTEDQLLYAEADVRHLFQIKRSLLEILDREGRRPLFDRCLAFLPTRIELDRIGFEDPYSH